jgi:cyanophycinase
VVGGGPTPAYCDGLDKAGEMVRTVVSRGVPYLGFSAGAMVASQAALVGGWRLDGRDVCPEEWSEGLEHVTLRQGLGLVPFTVDVHTAQAGLLGRAVSLVGSGRVDRAVAVDEDTCLALTDWMTTVVSGGGSVWSVVASGAGPSVSVTRDVSPSRPTIGRRP